MSIMVSEVSGVMLVILLSLYQRGNCSMCTKKEFLTNVEHGKMLPGYQMLNRSTDGIMQCSRLCLLRRRCKSFNFNSMTGECQLNTNSTKDVISLVADPDFIFSDISTWPSRVAGTCEDHTCPLNSFCDPVNEVCVVEYCLGVPLIENGVINSSNETSPFGTQLDITCNKGYFPESEVICQNNGTWSRGVCMALTSCSLVKQMQSANKDGEYWLVLTSNMYLSWIYCHRMSSDEPQEFLTLRNLNHGFLPPVSNEDCHGETELLENCTGSGGDSWFSKVKILNSTGELLEVDTKDRTFATFSNKKRFLRYGQAVDCYTPHEKKSISSCGVKGLFTIDLQGTGWRISEDQKWRTFLFKSFMHPPIRELNGTVIKLNCGGFYGGCKPAEGLFLTPYPEGLIVEEE